MKNIVIVAVLFVGLLAAAGAAVVVAGDSYINASDDGNGD